MCGWMGGWEEESKSLSRIANLQCLEIQYLLHTYLHSCVIEFVGQCDKLKFFVHPVCPS